MRPRYEVQVRHRYYGWVTAGNWPARTKTEALDSLDKCARPFSSGHVQSSDYRLVQLVPKVIAVRRLKRKRG